MFQLMRNEDQLEVPADLGADGAADPQVLVEGDLGSVGEVVVGGRTAVEVTNAERISAITRALIANQSKAELVQEGWELERKLDRIIERDVFDRESNSAQWLVYGRRCSVPRYEFGDAQEW